jgi:hypothetical protein
MNVLFLIAIIAVLAQDFVLIRDFALATFDRTMDLYETGWRYAQQVLDGVTVTG